MGFLDGLLGALSGLADEILQVLIFIFNLIVQVFQFIWQVIQLVAGYIFAALKAVGNFFVHLWDNVFKKVLLPLFNGVRKLTTFLETHLRPIIQFLQKVRKYIDKIYKTYVQPFLKMIQHIRQFLQILKLLHIKFAADLDRVLGQIQRDVQGAFLQVRGILNTAIDLLNIIADPTKLLRRPTLVLSIRRTIHALIRQTTGLPPGWYFPSPRKSAPKGLGFLPANFDASNPEHNPPASYYLGLDDGIPSLDFSNPDDPVPDSAVDGVDRFDYFNSDAWPDSDCLDASQCLSEALQAAMELV